MLTLAVAIDHYLADLRRNEYTPKTINGYRKRLLPYLRWAEGQHLPELGDLTVAAVRRFVSALQQDGQHAPGTVRNYVRDLKAFSSWLEREGYAPGSPLQAMRIPRTYEEPPEPFRDDELHTLFAALDLTDAAQQRDRLLFTLLLDTGMRVEELVRLRRCDISLPERTLMLRRTKNKGYRRVGFGEQTTKLLTRHLQAQDSGEALFLTGSGAPMTESSVQHRCLVYHKQTGIHVHAHRFRHTFAVRLIKAQVPLRVVQELLGHSDIRVTARYLRLTNDEVLEAQRRASPVDLLQPELRRKRAPEA